MVSTDEGSGIYEVVDAAPQQIPADEAIKNAVNLIEQSVKPLIIIGKGAAYAQCESNSGTC